MNDDSTIAKNNYYFEKPFDYNPFYWLQNRILL
jgi:hypothetical protein